MDNLGERDVVYAVDKARMKAMFVSLLLSR
jgi:hypothetical protein